MIIQECKVLGELLHDAAQRGVLNKMKHSKVIASVVLLEFLKKELNSAGVYILVRVAVKLVI
jgi:hypothetical protein